MKKRILIAQTGFLGDLVLTTGLLAATRAQFQEAEITVLVTPAARGLLDGHPAIDRVLVDDKRGGDGGIVGFLCAAARLRKEHFDLALAAHKSARTAMLLAAAGIPLRVGFRRWPQALFHHRRVRYELNEHYARRQLALLAPLGAGQERLVLQLSLGVTDKSRQEVEALLRQLPAAKGSLVGVFPGSAWTTKRWPAERYGALVQALEEDGFQCLICGGVADARVTREVVKAAGGCGIDLTGHTDMRLLVALMERMEIVVTNDSAPMHIASALRLPLVAIFCSTVPQQGYAPVGAAALVVDFPLDCRPCGRHGGRRCPLGTDACRLSIEVGDVREAVKKVRSLGKAVSRPSQVVAGLSSGEA